LASPGDSSVNYILGNSLLGQLNYRFFHYCNPFRFLADFPAARVPRGGVLAVIRGHVLISPVVIMKAR
jgi:hypothetical protein